jgi:uncharacterized protein YjiS (DUF1127 family)
MKITLKDFAPQPKMQFQPVEEDDDDLSQAIRGDIERQDDQWQLNEDLDGDKLSAFWDEALKDLGVTEPEATEEQA